MVGKDSKAWEYCWHVDSVGDKLEEEVDAKFCNELFSERNPMTACFHWRHLPYLGLFLKHYEAEEEDRKFS